MREQLEQILRGLPADRHVEIRRDSAWMICPNPEHSGGNERTPSFKVTTEEGQYFGSCFCFGCGASGGWRKTMALLGLGPEVKNLAVKNPHDVFSKNEEDDMLGVKNEKNELVTERWNQRQSWRGIPGNLLAAIGSRVDITGRDPKLVLPVELRKKLVGHVACRIEPQHDGFDYINMGGKSWSRDVLFPYDYVRDWIDSVDGLRVCSITEGPRDALTTIRNGLPALATLGSQSWSTKCANLVKTLSLDLLIVMADPDDAGELLEEKVYDDLRDYVRIKTIWLPSKKIEDKKTKKIKRVKLADPADLTAKKLRIVLDKSKLSEVELRPYPR